MDEVRPIVGFYLTPSDDVLSAISDRKGVRFMKIWPVDKLTRYMRHIRSMQRINMALARGAAASASRIIDLTNPSTWEFSGFSQNGEDGIIDVLTRQIIRPNHYFIEIGASDGLENNTTWIAMTRRFSGIWVEGDAEASDWCRYVFTSLNYGVESIRMFVTRDNVSELKKMALHTDPDVFSIDVDGNDYYLAEAVLSSGFRPKIFIVEYNSAFGPEISVTIPYKEDFRVGQGFRENLYYGCSVGAWRKLFSRHGYTFVTVDLNGVNAVFINPEEFDAGFVCALAGGDFSENFSQMREYKVDWPRQFDFIRNREIEEID